MGGYGPGDGIGNRSAWVFHERSERLYWADDAGDIGWTHSDRLECGSVHAADDFARVAFGPDHVYVVDRGIYRAPL